MHGLLPRYRMPFHVLVGGIPVIVGTVQGVVVASPCNPTRVAEWLVEFPEFTDRVAVLFFTSTQNPATAHIVDVDGEKQLIDSLP